LSKRRLENRRRQGIGEHVFGNGRAVKEDGREYPPHAIFHLNKARAWGYACGSFSLGDLTLPRKGVKQEQRSYTATESGRIIVAAKEPFATLWAIVFMLGLRIGEGIALRVSDLDFERKIIRVRQSVDSVTRKVKACKSDASSADRADRAGR
jgi:integrase